MHIFNYNWTKHYKSMLHTINIHRGLYHYTRLPFDIASALPSSSAPWRHYLEVWLLFILVMAGMYIDGRSQEEHLANLARVLRLFEDAEVRLKKEKCSFCLLAVENLGHSISSEGLCPSMINVQAITDAPIFPKVSELKSFLVLVNYYAKFTPNLATRYVPSHPSTLCYGGGRKSSS